MQRISLSPIGVHLPQGQSWLRRTSILDNRGRALLAQGAQEPRRRSLGRGATLGDSGSARKPTAARSQGRASEAKDPSRFDARDGRNTVASASLRSHGREENSEKTAKVVGTVRAAGRLHISRERHRWPLADLIFRRVSRGPVARHCLARRQARRRAPDIARQPPANNYR